MRRLRAIHRADECARVFSVTDHVLLWFRCGLMPYAAAYRLGKTS